MEHAKALHALKKCANNFAALPAESASAAAPQLGRGVKNGGFSTKIMLITVLN
jgi:hypothetical protein